MTNPTRCPFNTNLFPAHVASPTFVLSLSGLRLLLQDRLVVSYLSHQSLAGNHSLTGIIGGIPWKRLTSKISLPALMIGFHHKTNQTLRIRLSLPSQNSLCLRSIPNEMVDIEWAKEACIGFDEFSPV